MRVLLKNGQEKVFTLKDVASYEEYRGGDNRWDERAFVFRDGSILWEMMAFTSYAPDGSKYMRDGYVVVGGAHHDPTRIMGEYPDDLYDFVEMLKRNSTFATFDGAYKRYWRIRSLKIESPRLCAAKQAECPTQIVIS